MKYEHEIDHERGGWTNAGGVPVFEPISHFDYDALDPADEVDPGPPPFNREDIVSAVLDLLSPLPFETDKVGRRRRVEFDPWAWRIVAIRVQALRIMTKREGRPMSDVAAQLGVSKQHISKTLRRLRMRLGIDEPPPGKESL